MSRFVTNAVVLFLLAGSWNIVHAGDATAKKFGGKIIKEAKEHTVPRELEYVVNDAVEGAMSEMELLIEQVVSNVVKAAIAEQMSESAPEDIVIVDSEGNKLEILSMDEDGTITVAVEEVVVVDGEGNEIEISSVNEDGTITIDLSQEVEEQGNPYERYLDGGSSK